MAEEKELEEEPVCPCYEVREKTVPISDFMRGYLYGKTGELPPKDYTTIEAGYCHGAGPEEEECDCYGCRSQCNFYWPDGKSKAMFRADGSKRYT